MIRLTLEGLLQFDGVYELDFINAPLTNRELHLIKEVAGVRLGEFEAAAEAGDNDLLVAFAVIGLNRAGKIERNQIASVTDFMWDAEGGKITAEEVSEEEDEDDPLAQAEIPQPETSTTNEKQESSSDNSNGTGDALQETLPGSTGVQN